MENKKHLLRPCPICKEPQGLVLHTQKFTLPEKSVLPAVYDVVSCTKCGFCFADTAATQKDYDHYYNQMSKYEDKTTGSGGGTSDTDRKRLDTAASLINRASPDINSSILDIGCANGGLLQSLENLGYKDLTGIDITNVCVNNVKKLGYEAYFGGVFNLENLGQKKYDVVILSHVLEHLYDLKQTAHNLKNLVKTNGILYIEVPNAAVYHRYFVVPYYYFDCEHINHFDYQAIRNLFDDGNFILEAYEERDVYVTEKTRYPVVSTIIRKSGLSAESPKIIFTDRVREAIATYVETSKKKSDLKVLDEFISSKRPIFVWGAGMYTLRLLENTKLSLCQIVNFLDKDTKKQGNLLNKIEIKNPIDVLKLDKKSPIIIASAIYGEEIKKEIRMIDGNDMREIIVL